MNTEEAKDTSLLLRAGALAAPMEIVEERTVGPSLGADNITRGFHSTQIGFAAIAIFMIAYYLMFGGISVLALGANLLLLVALLSMLQATLTLPGMAGIALTLGMAIDSNVLINERIRDELRNGMTPQAAINAGYQQAFGTILDSNITTLIAGIALFMFGSGPIRGFAVVLCLGILTSMFSSVLVSRALVNLIYGRKARLNKVAIG
jgi:preprotein translocase subunit SecD